MKAEEIRVYEIFKQRFNEEEAAAVIEYFESKTDQKISEKKDLFLTKEDKVDIIKWMFIFWVGAVGVLSGVMFAMLHAYLK